ncbi:MAG: sensor histidine kinase [Flammeovirgaceae bacterium]
MNRSHALEQLKTMMDTGIKIKDNIAQNLHDDVNNLLTVIKENVDVLGGKVQDLEQKQQGEFDKVSALLSKTATEIEYISKQLKSNTLTKFGLEPALYELKETFASDRMHIDVQVYGLKTRLELNKEYELYRIAQELLSNALRHAQARAFSLQLDYSDQHITMTAEDNGIGFELDLIKQKKRSGLANIHVSVKELKGKVIFDSILREGTTVIIEIPAKKKSTNN